MEIDTGVENSQAIMNLLTEARAEADKLRARLKMMEQVVLSSRLIMGHELKKPATALAGYLELALEELDREAKQDAEACLKKAMGECDLLNQLNRFFLELLKVENKREVLRGSKIKLRDFVFQVIEHLPENLNGKERIKTRISPNIRNFHMSPDAFKIILSNVIENALRYSAKDKPVLVDIRRARDKRGLGDQDLLRITVTDKGVGIPAAHLKRIFRPFVRLEGDVTDGSGLGLTLVRSLVELYSGDVHIKSSQEGTIVLITIPETAKLLEPRSSS